jgi:hypothetical protein
MIRSGFWGNWDGVLDELGEGVQPLMIITSDFKLNRKIS